MAHGTQYNIATYSVTRYSTVLQYTGIFQLKKVYSVQIACGEFYRICHDGIINSLQQSIDRFHAISPNKQTNKL